MADAHLDERWSHTASLMALIANIHRDPKKGKRFTPDDFNPRPPRKPGMGTTRDARGPLPKAAITVLRDIFCPAPVSGGPGAKRASAQKGHI